MQWKMIYIKNTNIIKNNMEKITIIGLNKEFESIEDLIKELKIKTIDVPAWSELEKEYNPKKHPVFTDPEYRDKPTEKGIVKVTRIGIGLQKLAVKRMSQLMFGIPVKRIYKIEKGNKKQEEAAKLIEKIFMKNRIDSVNFERSKQLFSCCEFVTFWFATESENNSYGVNSKIKIRNRTYSPKNGDEIYPYFDDNDDLLALSFAYTKSEGVNKIKYFESFTAKEHVKYENKESGWIEVIREENKIGKIPAIYMSKDEPIWEDTSNDVYEIEWTLSRNGNYIRKNSKPLFLIFSDEKISTGNEKDSDDRSVIRFPEKAKADYATWEQATESMKMQIENLYRAFFTQLQIPDMSFDQMKAAPMSGEARKMMFIDSHLKVLEESGKWLESLDREINIIREFAKVIMPNNKKEIDELVVELQITPYKINDESEMIKNIMAGTGGKAVLSRREGITYLGWSDDVDKTLKEIEDEEKGELFEPTV